MTPRLFQFYVQRDIGRQGFSFAILTNYTDAPRRQQLTGSGWRDLDEGAYFESTLQVDRASLEQLMDEMWVAGIRPSDGEGSTGQLAATQNHLRDMRALVFQTDVKPRGELGNG